MVPKVIARGRSFKGAAAYLLHDKGRATSSERVAWTDTRNLTVEEPQAAWRIMAATALDQQRLKEAAGIKSTGRKSGQAVLHLSLSWHPDERDHLTPDEMRRAALGALKAIGAEDRQALLIAHNDADHPHLHILCNRVSPEDGRMLVSSNDRLHLSRWAEGYERERGKIRCEDRVVNNHRRRDGDYVRGRSGFTRTDEAAARVRTEGAQLIEADQRAKDHALLSYMRAEARKRQAEFENLENSHRQTIDALKREALIDAGLARRETGEAFHPLRKDMLAKHRKELDSFERQEKRLLGRMQNILDTVDLSALVRGDNNQPALPPVFRLLSSSGARRSTLLGRQDKELSELRKSQGRAYESQRTRIEVGLRGALNGERRNFLAARNALIREQDAQIAALKVAWRERGYEKQRATQMTADLSAHRGIARTDFSEAAQHGPSKRGSVETDRQRQIETKKNEILERLKRRDKKDRER